MFSKKFTRDLIIVMVLVSAAVTAPVVYLASQARRDISEQFIGNAANQAADQFRAMARAMSDTLMLMRDWGASGKLKLEKNEELIQLLGPVFRREQLLHGITVANFEGDSCYLHVTETGFRTSLVSGSGDKRSSEESIWSSQFEPQGKSRSPSNYDPRNRPWFAPALATDNIHWSDPYTFFTAQEIGITASISYNRKNDNTPVVIAFDILLDDLFNQMHELAPSANSRIFIFRRDAQLYMPETEDLKAEFIPIGSVENELIRKVHANWFGERQLINKVVSVVHEGQLWWCGFRPLDDDRKTTWICVMVPDNDILGRALQRSKRLWLIGIGSIIVASGLAFWLVRRYGRTSKSTAVFSRDDAEGSVRRIIADGESRYVEFKSTMRMNLHTKKPGKEIELAWMKGVAGFLNTDGGILLIGVTDEGEITGLERDVFENEDKCRLHFKNLISKHIGADLSKYIRFIIVHIDGKTVGVVRCDRASEPVFMKDGNKEHFYIRNGPSSDELPVSQALNYIKHRGQ